MKKLLKGFTLVELIIVMAILTILMTAILAMFKPVRSTYVDATLYENQRTAQNGIVKYITESVRYSTDLGIYSKDQVTNASGAVNAFAAKYCTENGITVAADVTAATNYIKSHAEIIIIDNQNAYEFKNEDWHGRIIRRKIVETTLGSGSFKPITDGIYSETAASPYYGTGWRVALGSAYYGDRNYTIALEDGDNTSNTDWKAVDGVKISVASYSKIGKDNAGAVLEKGALVTTNGEVLCKNQSVANGMFDTSKCTNAATSPAFKTQTATGTKVYIVFLNEKAP